MIIWYCGTIDHAHFGSIMTTSTVTRKYTLRLSFEPYNENHEYTKGSVNGIPPKNANEEITSLAEAVALTDAYYRADGALSWIAYWISESVTTTTVESNGKQTVTTAVTVDTEDAHVTYRSAEDYEKYVAGPSRQWEADRVTSGEAALSDAVDAESLENVKREHRGEYPLFAARIAYYTFKGYDTELIRATEAAYVKQYNRSFKGILRNVKERISA